MAGEEGGLFDVSSLLNTPFLYGWGDGGWWFVNCVLAILITGLIMGMFYAIGYAINSANLKRYSMSEFLQLAATAVLVIGLVGMLSMGSTVLGTMFGGTIQCKGSPISNHIDAAMCRTTEKLGYFNAAYEQIKEDNAGLEWLYYWQMTLLGVPFFQGMWIDDVYKPVETGHYIAMKIVSVMLSLNAQYFLLKYIKANMLATFLPLGIILRTLHFTRGIGGFFIALAVSLYFVYPGALFLMDATYAPPSDVPTPDYTREGVCDLPMFSGFSIGAIQPASDAGRGAMNSAARAAISTGNMANFVTRVFVGLFFDNMVAFAMALTVMRYATSLLGGEAGVFLQMMARWV
ncbi:MAG: hypothetical protein PHQ80_02240 [Candidatus ainarchaeum sp.]|nr:hypothetical protein [Candidatus ainarchaeum sp.]MDD5096493.1 hypothetical protein [Candidatus ainarchaeum sp.]